MRTPAFLALLLAASCGGDEPPPPDIQAAKQGITDTIQAYHKAGDKGDTSAMAELMTPDVVINKGIEDFVRGRDACVAELERRFEKLEDQQRKTLTDRPNIRIQGDMAVADYVADVGQQRAVISVVLLRVEGRWLIAHLHENWPVQP